jgi:hypothetical protein
MTGPSIGGGRWPVVVSAIVAAAMAAIALVTVERAGCADPGHYELHEGSYELVGGCVKPGDLPVVPQPSYDEPGTAHGAPVRP